jgi:cytochrome c peroxidase
VDAGADDPDPVLGSEVWALLQGLSPDALPAAPPDPTNRYADVPAAAAFGQKLFYDPSFSGPLLDGDTDGGPETDGS